MLKEKQHHQQYSLRRKLYVGYKANFQHWIQQKNAISNFIIYKAIKFDYKAKMCDNMFVEVKSDIFGRYRINLEN